MKKIFYLLVCVILFSCSKNNNEPRNTTGSIEYKFNGQLTRFDNANISNGEGVIFSKQLKGIVPETRYLLNAGIGSNNLIGFTIVTDSLQMNSYHYDSSVVSGNIGLYVFVLTHVGQQSMLYFSGDCFDIKISSHKNGLISGTFSAKFTPLAGGLNYKNKGTVLITDGKLTNVPVIY